MRGNKYIGTVSGLYINYILFGMVNIILASHMSFLSEQLNTDKSGVSFLVAAMGMGRLLTLYIASVLSDKFGRKPFVLGASILFIVFLVGIPLSPSVPVAVVFSFLAGVAISMSDSGTYPALMEAFPKTPGSATVLVRGFVSVGSTLLPLIIVYFMNHEIYYGYSFFLPALVFLFSFIILSKMKFPSQSAQGQNSVKNELNPEMNYVSKPKFWQEGVCLIIIGFTGQALLYILQLWLPTFGQEVVGLNEANSLKLLSYYSIGSLASVITLVLVLHRIVKPVTVLLIYPGNFDYRTLIFIRFSVFNKYHYHFFCDWFFHLRGSTISPNGYE
ncbi:MFS transporter [Bacillus sp. T3]|uniref:MFS transporter n=1 Tax=Bacillus sp. T3 TaxID=467262 RepID=UPI002981F648|nr:MFS transporter [Bacillus sp. T3]